MPIGCRSITRGRRRRNCPPVADAGPLAGLHIALDPGHLGGAWAKMEERWFQIKKAPPIQEGDMTLKVAKLLAPRLESLGAKVSLVRAEAEPTTPYRPSDFREIALQILHRNRSGGPAGRFRRPGRSGEGKKRALAGGVAVLPDERNPPPRQPG